MKVKMMDTRITTTRAVWRVTPMATYASRTCVGPSLQQAKALPLFSITAGRRSTATLKQPQRGLSSSSSSSSLASSSLSSSPSSSPSWRPLVFQLAAAQEASVSTLILQEVEFTWKGEASEVLLTGDFLNWDSKLPLVKRADGTFGAKQKLAPGNYSYKYIVNGEWMHSPDQPTVPDGNGGFNNQLCIPEAENENSKSKVTSVKKDSEAATSTATVEDSGKAEASKKVVSGSKAAKKPVEETIADSMSNKIIPALKDNLSKEKGVTSVDIIFEDNQLQGTIFKNGIAYSFWAFFPDGVLEGSRGFSLASYGSPPSTIEPFLVDEKKITPDLVVFWITKRLFAHKMLAFN